MLACAQSPAEDAERAALEVAAQRWVKAANAGDVATLTATMTEDVELIDDRSTVTGREAAIRALGEVLARGQVIATPRETTLASDIAWRLVGLVQSQKNGDVHARGQAMEIWKRVNHEWRLHRRVTAGATPPPVSVTRPSTSEPVLDRPKK